LLIYAAKTTCNVADWGETVRCQKKLSSPRGPNWPTFYAASALSGVLIFSIIGSFLIVFFNVPDHFLSLRWFN
jgi:hypothetical protein